MKKEDREKMVLDARNIARELEAFANLKIELTETIVGREFSVEERDDLYFSTIKDHLYLVFLHRPEINPLLLGNALQGEEMFSPTHLYFTVKDNNLNRDPTAEEVVKHYSKDRASRFRERFDEIMKVKSKKKSWSITLKVWTVNLGKFLMKPRGSKPAKQDIKTNEPKLAKIN